MPGPMPAVGEYNYNGVDFPATTRTLSVRISSQKDEAGRTNFGNNYVYRLHTFFGNLDPSIPVDSANYANMVQTQGVELERIREELTENGKIFIHKRKGLGDIVVNGNGTPDLEFGPWVDLVWKPHGELVAECEITISFLISDCNNNPFGRPMEAAYDIAYSQDVRRLTTRQINGFIRIPSGRSGVNSIADSADNYYESVVPPVPDGYTRINETRRLSYSKTRLNFSFTDTMRESPLPQGCIEYDFRHSHQTTNRGFVEWEGRFDASYHMVSRFENPAVPLSYFLSTVSDRLQKLPDLNLNPGTAVIPYAFGMTDDIAHLTSHFFLAYTVSGKVARFLVNSMWRGPGLQHDDDLWAASMADAYQPGGFSFPDDRVTEDADVIVDLCTNAPPVEIPEDTSGGAVLKGTILESLGVTCPDPDDSWIDYSLWLTFDRDDNLSEHKPLAQGPVAPSTNGPGLSLGEREALEVFGGDDGYTTRPQTSFDSGGYVPGGGSAPAKAMQVQNRSTPVFHVILHGRAVRACYPINEARLESIGGAEAIQSNREGVDFFRTAVIANVGIPLIAAEWQSRWAITDHPTEPMLPAGTPLVAKEDQGEVIAEAND